MDLCLYQHDWKRCRDMFLINLSTGISASKMFDCTSGSFAVHVRPNGQSDWNAFCSYSNPIFDLGKQPMAVFIQILITDKEPTLKWLKGWRYAATLMGKKLYDYPHIITEEALHEETHQPCHRNENGDRERAEEDSQLCGTATTQRETDPISEFNKTFGYRG